MRWRCRIAGRCLLRRSGDPALEGGRGNPLVEACISPDNVAVAFLLYVLLLLLQLLRLDAKRADHDTACLGNGGRRQTGFLPPAGSQRKKQRTLLAFQINNVLFIRQDAHVCD